MTTPTNWPDPMRPGVPMFPERDGWHVVLIDEDRREFWWDTECSYFTTAPDGDLLWTIEEAASEFSYVGPCLTPAQIAEMLAAEQERCVEALQEVSEGYRKNAQEIGTVTATNGAEERIEAVDDCWVKIRNLGAAP